MARTLYDTVAQYTLDIQAVSCDEMLVDLTDVIQDRSISSIDFAQHLRQEMKIKTGCNASVGIGSSILLARMATKKACKQTAENPSKKLFFMENIQKNFFVKLHFWQF